MISLKGLAEMYDILYEQADNVVKEYDLCQFKDGRCARDRVDGPRLKGGCCRVYKCVHLGQKGCKTKSLRCKTFLCEYLSRVRRTDPTSDLAIRVISCMSALGVIDSIAVKTFRTYTHTTLDYFKSKREVLKKVEELRNRKE